MKKEKAKKSEANKAEELNPVRMAIRAMGEVVNGNPYAKRRFLSFLKDNIPPSRHDDMGDTILYLVCCSEEEREEFLDPLSENELAIEAVILALELRDILNMDAMYED